MMTKLDRFSWGSSEVDWCESNFKITQFVAEFYNTISNVLFFVMPPLLVYLFRQYARQVTWGVNVVWLLLIVVGAGSVYFHATLSLVGQLIDEIAIIWVFMAALALWFPKRYMPIFLHQDRHRFQMLMVGCTVLSSGLACVMPAVNALVLMVLGVPATILLISELKQCQSMKVYKLGVRCCTMWCVALTAWVLDRFFCNIWELIGFPYLHCFWHIFIFLASYVACVLFAYFDAKQEVPEQMPTLRYWPHDNWTFFGIPYISLMRGAHKPADRLL